MVCVPSGKVVFHFFLFAKLFLSLLFPKRKKEKAAPVYSLGGPEGRVSCCLAWISTRRPSAHAGQKRRGVEGAGSPCMAAIQRVWWGVSGRWGATNGGGSRSRVPHSLRCRVSRSGAGEPCKEEGRRRSRGVPAEQGRDHRERRRQRNFKYSRLRRLASNGGVNTMLASRKRSPSRYPLRVTSDLPA